MASQGAAEFFAELVAELGRFQHCRLIAEAENPVCELDRTRDVHPQFDSSGDIANVLGGMPLAAADKTGDALVEEDADMHDVASDQAEGTFGDLRWAVVEGIIETLVLQPLDRTGSVERKRSAGFMREAVGHAVEPPARPVPGTAAGWSAPVHPAKEGNRRLPEHASYDLRSEGRAQEGGVQ